MVPKVPSFAHFLYFFEPLYAERNDGDMMLLALNSKLFKQFMNSEVQGQNGTRQKARDDRHPFPPSDSEGADERRRETEQEIIDTI